MRTLASVWWFVGVLGCGSAPVVASDPPVRELHAIPWVPARASLLADERAGLDAALAVYRDWGLTEPVQLELAESVNIPFADAPNIHTWRFLGDGPSPRAHIDAVSQALYGGRLDGWVARLGGEARATRALEAWMSLLFGHEAAHVVAAERGIGAYMTDPWLEETRAIHFETAVARELMARGALPPDTLELAMAVNRELLAAAPPGLVAGLPRDEAARRERFNAGYYFLAEGNVAGHELDVAAVLALYTTARLELAAAPPEAKDALLARLGAAPADPHPMASAARAFLHDANLPFDAVDDATLTGRHADPDGKGTALAMTLTPTEPAAGRASIALEVRAELPEAVRPKRRAAVAAVINRGNAERSDRVCDLAPDAKAIRCRTMVPASDDLDTGLRLGMLVAMRFFVRWGDAIAAVHDKGADPWTVAPAAEEETP